MIITLTTADGTTETHDLGIDLDSVLYGDMMLFHQCLAQADEASDGGRIPLLVSALDALSKSAFSKIRFSDAANFAQFVNAVVEHVITYRDEFTPQSDINALHWTFEGEAYTIQADATKRALGLVSFTVREAVEVLYLQGLNEPNEDAPLADKFKSQAISMLDMFSVLCRRAGEEIPQSPEEFGAWLADRRQFWAGRLTYRMAQDLYAFFLRTYHASSPSGNINMYLSPYLRLIQSQASLIS